MMPIRAKKSFSQNWLIDDGVLETIINTAKLKRGERVLEIGPGTGILTEALLDTGACVTAVEADKDLIEPLEKKFGGKITLVHDDIFSFVSEPLHLSALSPFHLVSNIPYNITSDILRVFLTSKSKPQQMILLLQREVVDRIVAKPPKMSLLSVVCQLYACCEKTVDVPRAAFRPIPKVDSAVVRLVPRKTGSDDEREKIIKIAKAGFSNPRKQLHGNLCLNRSHQIRAKRLETKNHSAKS